MLDPLRMTNEELLASSGEVKETLPDEDVMRRSIAAYLRLRKGNLPDRKALLMFRGKQYVVLADNGTTLAVYRVRNDRMLKHLRRVPLPVAAFAELHLLEKDFS